MKKGIISTGYNPTNVSVIPNSCDLELFDVNDKSKTLRDFRQRHNIPNDSLLIVYQVLGKINGVIIWLTLQRLCRTVQVLSGYWRRGGVRKRL